MVKHLANEFDCFLVTYQVISFRQIEEDLDKASVARMNEYGTSDDVKESFDNLQQRVKMKYFLVNQSPTNSS